MWRASRRRAPDFGRGVYSPGSTHGKGHHVTLLVAENSGALSPAFRDLLRLYGRVAARPFACDATAYGTARTSPRAYYAHHLAAISSAIQRADAQTVLRLATDLALSTVT